PPPVPPLGGERPQKSCGCGGPCVGSTPSKRLLTDSPAWIREIALANRSAMLRTCSSGQLLGAGTVSVVTTSVNIGCWPRRSTALPVNRPWVHATDAEVAPASA